MSADKDKIEKARIAAGQYSEILGKGNFFLEMQYQGLEEQKIVNRGILPLARELNLLSRGETVAVPASDTTFGS